MSAINDGSHSRTTGRYETQHKPAAAGGTRNPTMGPVAVGPVRGRQERQDEQNQREADAAIARWAAHGRSLKLQEQGFRDADERRAASRRGRAKGKVFAAFAWYLSRATR